MAWAETTMGSNGHIACEVTQVSQNVAGNYSQVRVRGIIWLNAGKSSADNTNNCKAEISGTNAYGPITANFSASGTTQITVVDATFTVYHDSAGNASVGYTFTFGPTITSNFGSAKASVYCSLALTRIPKAPSATSWYSQYFSAPSSLYLSWYDSNNNGSAVTNYEIEFATNSSYSGSSFTSSGTTSNMTITGLALGATYYFRVRSTNAYGTSGWSANTSFSVPNVPSAPVLSLSNFSAPSTINISWTAPANNGAAITDYILEYANTSGFTGATAVSNATNTSRSITGLSIGTTWYFRIKAVNSQGSSAWSNVLSYDFPNIPGTPSNPTIIYSPPSTIDLTMTAPANNGATILDYEISYDDNSSFVSPDTILVAAPTLTATISGLSPGTTYWFKYRARNSQGWGTYSEAVSIFLYAGPRVKNLNVYKNTVCYIKIGGVWKVAIPYVRLNGTWKVAGG